MQPFPIKKCFHTRYEIVKLDPCQICDGLVCIDCARINEANEIRCPKCFRNEYPDDFKYVYEIPDAKDFSPVNVVITQSRIDFIKKKYSRPGATPVVILGSHKSIIQLMKTQELNELRRIPDKLKPCSEKQSYITDDGSFIDLDDYLNSSDSITLRFTDPYDSTLHEIINEFKSKNLYFKLTEIFPSRTDIHERMLTVFVSIEQPSEENKFPKFPFGEKLGSRVIATNIE